MIPGVFGSDFTAIERAMDLRMIRQQLLASDVANLETPHFRALDLDFRESLRRVMEYEESKAAEGFPVSDGGMDSDAGVPAPELKVVGIDGLVGGSDTNAGSLELLMGRLGENETQYGIAATLMSAKLRSLLDAIGGLSR